MCHTCLHSFDRRKGRVSVRVISSLHSEKRKKWNGDYHREDGGKRMPCIYIYRRRERARITYTNTCIHNLGKDVMWRAREKKTKKKRREIISGEMR